MSKHIKIRGQLLDEEKVRVTILKQTHIGSEFGNGAVEGYPSNTLFTIKKKCKYGLYYPKGWEPQTYRHDSFFKGTLFLMSENIISEDSPKPTFTCTLEEYKELKHLVIEYNKWGETQ